MSQIPNGSGDSEFDVEQRGAPAHMPYDPGQDPPRSGPTETRLLPTWPIQVPVELPRGMEIPEEQPHGLENPTPEAEGR